MALLRRLLTTLARPCIRPHRSNIHPGVCRYLSLETVSHPSNRVQVYISRSTDPYLNLSIEHFLLQKSPLDSFVLFLYTNRPCVVIGRNQNPWVEVNLGALKRSNAIISGEGSTPGKGDESPKDDGVLLVRRRSGGGTVFHDLGNVNYSVICPSAPLDRNKHAAMVVRALSTLAVPENDVSFRVNERHDIVLDVSSSSAAAQQQQPQTQKTFKVSGSAYKLICERFLHHGTCLLSSPNLSLVGALLRSPAAPYIKARGAESVRSAIRNVGVADLGSFEEAVVAEFGAMYGAVDPEIIDAADVQKILEEGPFVVKGYVELQSPEWIYTQTPQFTFSLYPTSEDPRPRPALPATMPPSPLAMTVRHGQIVDVFGSSLLQPLISTYLHQVPDWRPRINDEYTGTLLNYLFGVGPIEHLTRFKSSE
ncbi:uncharacterized protein F4807DRAFT_239738 [Annulohypoxylon truncatum]|uniref:uncharacterized protein n=1 Tax=Annulohypoxylon truncatum TaxID=327061 RepID=UPI00200837DE|nr:uncharacterized protein F4807DRAFT_239738 [Annulohypoxylon truncatum]KAI1206166.1 hypothetical protein F4807DRAFT_239738 [Annulohypoxylon truncatum]